MKKREKKMIVEYKNFLDKLFHTSPIHGCFDKFLYYCPLAWSTFVVQEPDQPLKSINYLQ